jgi:hypothetical protein
MLKSFMFAAVALLCAAAATAAPPTYAPLPSPPKVDPATIAVPDLSFTPTAETQAGYDKYFYFHRSGTDFPTAYADIRECDQYARGFAASVGGDAATQGMMNQMITQYGMAGAVGGAIGSAVADAIFGSAERRKMRRTNLKTCMGFKEYKAYGLPKEIWSKFNFEEGLTPPSEEERERKLEIQAKIASGPQPGLGEIAK